MRKLPGITREEEEQKLQDTISIAERRLERSKRDVQALADELHEMLEVFDENDKEALALWHNTDARFTEVKQEVRQAEQARKKPYFGRIDFQDKRIGKDEVYYIGRSVIAEDPAEPDVIDWRAPIAGVYYDAALGDVTYSVKGEGKFEITLSRKRTYEIENDRLKDFYDSDVVANDELLTKYLARNKRAVLSEIIATIQQEQNEVIRKKPQHNMIVQGAAGSGKTTVAMHRISYILYNYELEFAPQDFYIIGSNQVLLNYITGVLPELNVYGVSQMTMEQLFVRLLYEDWDKHKYTVKPVRRGVTPPVKGTFAWFHDLEAFCERYERNVIPRGDVCIEKNGVVLLTEHAIERIWKKCRGLSRADKISRLTEHLMAKLENEISGKYYSYSADEKKRMLRYYETYFGKREWKGSIFELYDAFLEEQIRKTAERERQESQDRQESRIEFPGTEFDVYDLAALAYLYKRIKEDEIIREAGHVVIDEAQDFGMMVYGSLKYCLSKCTYTIMGDVSQNISVDYGLNDWQDLRKLMLPDEFDYFGLLRKSYRNTVEIANFATDILYHGDFQIYPVEPIIRHGNEVRVVGCADFEELLRVTAETAQGWLQAGLETIAVVCADGAEAERVRQGLGNFVMSEAGMSCRSSATGEMENAESQRLPLLSTEAGEIEFREGVMVLPLEYTKGLEFDAVLIFDASQQNYPPGNGYVKRLYVAATRALHELTVLYQGELTGLIAEPVSEEAKKRAVLQVSEPKRGFAPKEPEKTHAEVYRQQAKEAELEMRERGKYGPQRIEQQLKQEGKIYSARQEEPEQEKPQKAQQEAAPRQAVLQETRQAAPEVSAAAETKLSLGEFGDMPDNSALRPAGHSKIDCAVRFVMKGSGYYDIFSSYGTLRITPMSQEVVRVCFAKGQCSAFPEPAREFAAQNPAGAKTAGQSVRFRAKEGIGSIDISMDKLTVRVDKKTGILSFLTPQGKSLLSERVKEPRQIGTGQCWAFFDWKKDEQLIARGIAGSEQPFLEIGNSARYISFGGGSDQMPALASSKKYEMHFPAGGKVLCCNIPMYGPYVSVEGTEVVDYYFKVV